MREMARDLSGCRPFAWALFVRDLKTQYNQALLGVFWALLPPLAGAAVLLVLGHAKVLSSRPPENIPLPIFLLAGALYWQLFLDALLSPGRMVESARILVAKLAFPREGLIVAALLSTGAGFLIRFTLLLAACWWFGCLPSPHALVGGGVAVFPLVAFGLCLGLLFLPFSLLFRDFAAAIAIGSTLLLFLTPIGYYVSNPAVAPEYVRWNPLTYLVGFPRDAFFSLPLNTATVALGIGAAAVTTCLGGWLLFRVSLPLVMERIGG